MWDYFYPLLSVVLAIMGAVVTVDAPTDARRKLWIAAFIVVGVVAAVVGVLSVKSAHDAQGSLIAQLTGGDNFAYLKAELGDDTKSTDHIPLLIVNDGTGPVYHAALWISPEAANGNAKDPAYWSMGGIYPPIVYVGTMRAGPAILPGNYHIDISAANGSLWEILRIVEFKGKLIQTIDVYRTPTHEKAYSSPRPAGFTG